MRLNLFKKKKISDPPTVENSFERIYRSVYEKLQAPECIEWMPTYHCNSNCVYCGGYDENAVNDFGALLSFRRIKSLIKQSRKKGTFKWYIGGRGGEPFLYPNMLDIMREIKVCGLWGTIITNGTLLNEEHVKRLVSMQWDILKISIDSNKPEVHDSLRGMYGNFKQIDQALDLFKKYKKELNVNSPRLITSTVISSKNYKYISEFIDYCIDKGFAEIQFIPIRGTHAQAKSLFLTKKQKMELIDILKARRDEKRIDHCIDFIISMYEEKDRQEVTAYKQNKLYCMHLWKTMLINEDGFLCPCCAITDRLLPLGRSYLKTWNSKEMNILREKILNGIFIHENCKTCCGPTQGETYAFNEYVSKRIV